MILEKITDLILQSIQGADEAKVARLREFAKAVMILAKAADDYEDRSRANDGDDAAEATMAERLVEISSTLVDLSSREKLDHLKALIAELYDDPDTELETAGETLFAAAVDFRLAASTMGDLIGG